MRPNSGKPINNASREMCPAFDVSKISRWLKTLVHYYFFYFLFHFSRFSLVYLYFVNFPLIFLIWVLIDVQIRASISL